MASPPTHRLRIKTNLQGFCLATPLPEEDPAASRAVYLVTFPHVQQAQSAGGVPLKAPGDFSRQQIASAIRSACDEPMHDPRWLARRSNFVARPARPLKLVVFREYHAQNEAGERFAHYHVGLLLASQTRYLPLKRALLHRFGLASHWSCVHTGYHSTVRYGIRASPDKPAEALDPAPFAWAVGGPHPWLEAAAAEPTTARALEARRVHEVQRASEAGNAEPRVQEIDVWPVVVRAGVRNTPDDCHADKRLIAYAKENCSPKMVAWMFKNRSRLSGLVDDVWAWEEVARV